jgi:hypothetical protein
MRTLVPAPLVASIVALVACSTHSRDEQAKQAAVTQASGTPTTVTGNPTCQDLGYAFSCGINTDYATHCVMPRGGGPPDITVNVSFPTEDSFDWSATGGIDAVIVYGYPDATLYTYGGSTGETGLVANGGGLVYFCARGEAGLDAGPDAPSPSDGGGSSGSTSSGSTSSGSTSSGSTSGGGTSSGSTSGGGTSRGSTSSGGTSGKTW